MADSQKALGDESFQVLFGHDYMAFWSKSGEIWQYKKLDFSMFR